MFIAIKAFFLTSNVTGGISDFLCPPSYPADSNTVFFAWEIESICLSVNPCRAILKTEFCKGKKNMTWQWTHSKEKV